MIVYEYSLVAKVYAIIRDFIHYSFLPYISVFDHKIYIRDLNLTVYMPSDSLQLIDEIYCLPGYFKHYNGLPKIIVDVGAHCGLFTLISQRVFRPKLIISLEPSKLNYRYLIRNVHINNLKNTITLNNALWVRNTKIHFAIKGRWSGEASIAPEVSNTHLTNIISTVTMNDILNIITETTDYDKIDFLKVDIEGAELPIFTLNNTWLNRVEHLVMEVHWHKYGFSGINRIIETLRKYGFNNIICCKAEFNYKESLRQWLQLLKDNNYLSTLLYVIGKSFLSLFRRTKRLNLLIATKRDDYA